MTGLLVEILMGCAILTFGGMLTQRGAVRVARALRNHPALGRTLGIWFLALPALVVVLEAATGGSPDIALGSIIGSVTFGMLGVLGIAALILPLTFNPALIKRDGSLLVAACLLLAALGRDGALTRSDGIILLVAFAAYAFYCCRTLSLRPPDEILPAKKCGIWCAGAYVLVGAALLVTGGNLLIDGALGIAALYNLPEASIAASIIGACVTLPLLLTVLLAVRQGENEAAIAQAISANIFTLLAIPGFIFYLNPIPVAPPFIARGFACMTGACAVSIILLFTGKKLTRREGTLFLALYAAYAVYQYA